MDFGLQQKPPKSKEYAFRPLSFDDDVDLDSETDTKTLRGSLDCRMHQRSQEAYAMNRRPLAENGVSTEGTDRLVSSSVEENEEEAVAPSSWGKYERCCLWTAMIIFVILFGITFSATVIGLLHMFEIVRYIRALGPVLCPRNSFK